MCSVISFSQVPSWARSLMTTDFSDMRDGWGSGRKCEFLQVTQCVVDGAGIWVRACFFKNSILQAPWPDSDQREKSSSNTLSLNSLSLLRMPSSCQTAKFQGVFHKGAAEAAAAQHPRHGHLEPRELIGFLIRKKPAANAQSRRSLALSHVCHVMLPQTDDTSILIKLWFLKTLFLW